MCIPLKLRSDVGQMFSLKPHELASAAALAAISAALQVVLHVGWASPWGMWIDLVAIPWMVAYFIFGGRTAFSVSLVGAIIITFGDFSTWLGALMKFASTLPMWLVPFAIQKTKGLKPQDFRKLRLLVPAVAAALLLRGVVAVFLNYYFALPIWTGMQTSQLFDIFPWWIIFGLNAIQGVLEVAAAWLLVFRSGLARFAK